MTKDETTDTLLAKLTAWNREAGGFHEDRQLADEVLISCGWDVKPDPAFRGGIVWSFGTNPHVGVSEDTRPHPIHSLDHALGQIPFGWRVCSMKQTATSDIGWAVMATDDHQRLTAFHSELTVAVCMAAVRTWRRTRHAD